MANPRLVKAISRLAPFHIPISWSFVARLSPLRKKVAGNIGWVISGNCFQTLVGLFVLAMIARHLGPDRLGMLSYAINLAVLFTSIATLGMEGIVIRDMVKAPHLTETILGTAFTLRMAGASVAIVGVVVTAWMIHSDRWVIPYVILIGLAFFPQAFEVIDLWFQKNIQSKFSVLAKSTAVFVGGGIKLTFVLLNAPLIFFCAAYTLDFALIAVAMVWIYRNRGQHLLRWRFSFPIAAQILRDSWPLILSGVLIISYMRIEQFLVMNFLGSHVAGIYFASCKIVEIWVLMAMIILNSVYPILVLKRHTDLEVYHQKMQFVFDFMTGAGIFVAIGIFLFAPQIIQVLYGSHYSEATKILVIQAWMAPILFCGAARGCYFLLENITIYHTWGAMIGIIFNVLLAFPLMERYGASGAAAAALISYVISVYGTSYLFPRLRECARFQTRALVLPFRFSEFRRNLNVTAESSGRNRGSQFPDP